MLNTPLIKIVEARIMCDNFLRYLTRNQKALLSQAYQKHYTDGRFTPQSIANETDYNDRAKEVFRNYKKYETNNSLRSSAIISANSLNVWLMFQTGLLALIAPVIIDSLRKGDNVTFVSTSNPYHECQQNKLSLISSRQVRRKQQSMMTSLNKQNRRIECIAIIEVNERVVLDGTRYYAPHLHMICVGISKEELKDFFSYKGFSRYSGTRSSKHTDIKQINCGGEVISKILYMTKHKPEVKTVYLDRHGHRNSSRNIMQDSRGEWASWFDDMDISEVVTLHGYTTSVKNILANNEMGIMAKKAYELCRHYPPHEPVNCQYCIENGQL